MSKKLVLVLVVLALVAAAGTVPARGVYRITLGTSALVKGTTLAPGEYKLTLGDAKVTIAPIDGKVLVETAVKVEASERRYSGTVVTYERDKGNTVISEIEIGGSKTKLVFAR